MRTKFTALVLSAVPYCTPLWYSSSLATAQLKYARENFDTTINWQTIPFNIFHVVWISIFIFHHFFKALLIPAQKHIPHNNRGSIYSTKLYFENTHTNTYTNIHHFNGHSPGTPGLVSCRHEKWVLVWSGTDWMPFQMLINRNALGLTFSTSTTTTEGVRKSLPFASAQPMP